MKTSIVILFSIALLLCTHCEARKCRALAMSGGGSKGAYEAAVIMGLTNYVPNPEEELAWDVVTGVSAGSLNTLGMGGYKANDVHGAAAFLYALWNSIPDYNAYGNWPGGIAEGLLLKGGIFDLSPGVEWVTGQWGDNKVKRKVSFATTDAAMATYEVYDYNDTDTLPRDYIESAFASSSIPAVFPPTIRGDKTLVDGGVIWNLDVPSAVRRCHEIVDDDKDIIVDFILCGDHSLATADELSRYTTMGHLMRGIEINSFYNGMSDYQSSVEQFPDVEFRYVIAPSENIATGMIPLDFSRAQIDKCYEVGDKDAKNAVKLGSGGYGQALIEFAEKRKRGEKVSLDEMVAQRVKELENVTQKSE